MTAAGGRLKAAGPGQDAARTRIKCCGMFREQDIAAVNVARPDFCGFIVDFPRSHRSITPERLGELSALLDPEICPVGVFVDEDPEQIVELAGDGAIRAVQLHGHEDAGYVADLRRRLPEGVPIIQAFRIHDLADAERARHSLADLVLLDNGQGTGERFDWSLVEGVDRPFLLAGGLGPDNVGEAIAAVHPWGVDMSSGLETDGLKDPAKIKAAVAAVRRQG